MRKRKLLLLTTAVFLLWCSSPSLPAEDTVDLGAVPGVPEGGATTNTSVTTFALSSLSLGDTTPDGGEGLYDQAWVGWGYDVDDRVTTADSP